MRPARSIIGLHEGVLFGLLLSLGALVWCRDASFLDPATQLELSTHAAELALLALPMTLIVIAGGIDLSVGSTMALAAVIFGLSFEAGAHPALAAAAALALGAAAGALNGVFIARLGVHPLVVTLATLAAYRGLAEGISRARPISGFPDTFQHLGAGTLAGIPIPTLLCLVAFGIAVLVTSRATFGFRIYTIGDNERAARYAGVPVDRIKLILYTLSGATAGLAALVLIARRNTAKADAGLGIELEVITAVVLGGVSIHGGRGRVLGVALAVLLLHELREFVSWHWQNDELILLVTGGILIAAVLLNNIARRRRA